VQIDTAEDRHKFSSVLDKIGVDQPEWTEATSLEAAKQFANKVGQVVSFISWIAVVIMTIKYRYPVLIRPSYVLSGAAMNVVYEESALEYRLSAAASVSPLHPVVVTKFIDGAQEIDVDAVAHKGKLIVHAVSEHVESAGVHSGDATLVLPPYSIPEEDMERLKIIAEKVAQAFEISGPFNMQIIRKEPDQAGEATLKVIECNLRASRSFPFVSKVLGHNFIDTATCAIVGQDVPVPLDLMKVKRNYTSIKVAQFSWTRLQGADPFLGVGQLIRQFYFSDRYLTTCSQRWPALAKSLALEKTSTKHTGHLYLAPLDSKSLRQALASLLEEISINQRWS